MKLQKILLTVISIFVFTLCLSVETNATTDISAHFDTSFINAVCQYLNIEEDKFTATEMAKIEELHLSGMNITAISDATGLSSYFSSLKVLDISNNSIKNLPNLPTSLVELNCSSNNISALTPLPEGLKILNCSNNSLPGLPDLPATLTSLDCSNNKLPGLPDLPAALTSFDCSDNELPALPALPAGLLELNISNNVIDELPILPSSLKTLNIEGTKITTVEANKLPATLVTFSSDLVLADNGNYYDSLDNVPSTDEGTTDDTTQDTTQGTDSEEEKDETPKTGVSSYIGIAVVVIALSTISIISLKRRNA